MLQDVTFIHLRICVTTVGLFGRPLRYLHRTISPRRPLLEGGRERGSDAFWEGNIYTAGVYRSFLKPYPPTPPLLSKIIQLFILLYIFYLLKLKLFLHLSYSFFSPFSYPQDPQMTCRQSPPHRRKRCNFKEKGQRGKIRRKNRKKRKRPKQSIPQILTYNMDRIRIEPRQGQLSLK